MSDTVMIVVGDLTVDVLVEAHADIPANRESGKDVTLLGGVEERVGGSALLMARALSALGAPLIIAARGADSFGDAVEATLRAEGFSTSGVQAQAECSTSVVNLTHFPDGTRLMVRPTTHAGRNIDPGTALTVARQVERECKLLFISGYSLLGNSTPSINTASELARWARQHSIPICIDLVPHEFAESVGNLQQVALTLGGKPDVAVAELRTLRGLGLASKTADLTEIELADAARQFARFAKLAIAQHQVHPSIYAQAVAHGNHVDYTEYPFHATDRLGLGDILLVHALCTIGLLKQLDSTNVSHREFGDIFD